MAGVAFQDQREFRCVHCSGKILVPRDLPPMTGPCPHCGSTITSPDPKDDKPPQQVSATVEVPAVATERVEVPAARASAGPPPLPPAAGAKPAESRFAPPPTAPLKPAPDPVAKQEPVSPFASPGPSPASPALLTPPPPLIRVEPVDLPGSLGVPDMTYHPGHPQAPAADHAAAAREAAAKEAAARETAEREIARVKEAAAKEIAAAKEAAEREAAAAREAAAKEAAEREAAARDAAAKEIAAAREAAEKQAAAAREAAAKEALAREAAAREAAEKEAAARELAAREAAAKDAAAREIAARQAAEKEAAEKEAAAREAAAKEVAAAREAAAKEIAARQAAERETAAAREAVVREAAARETAAREAAAREAAAKEAAAKEAAAREAAEREAAAARETAAKEAAAREAVERETAFKEAAARQAAERQAAIAREEIARATAAREALLKEATAKEAAAREAAEREVAAAREAAAREAAEREALAKEAAAKEAAAKEAAARSTPRSVVSIGLGPEPPRAAPPAPPVEPAAVQPEPARAAPEFPPVAAAPAAPPASAPELAAAAQPKPVPGRVSIGLSDEALNTLRPPASAPAGRVPDPVPVPAPAVLASGEAGKSLPPRTSPKQANRSRKGLVISMLVLLLVILGGGWAALNFINKMADPTSAKSGAQPKLAPANRPGSNDPNAWQEEARQTLSEFLKADTPAGKAAFSIRGSELLPRMIAFYGPGPIDDSDTPLSGFAVGNLLPEDHKRGIYRMTFDRPPQFELKEFFSPIAPLEVQMKVEEPDLLLSSLARVGNFTSEPVKVDVFLKRTPDGLKVDWETFVQTKYRTFRNFTELHDPGQSGVFRVFVMEDVPEKGRATIGHKTYNIIDPAYRTDSVRVEVPVDSELGRALSKVNWLGVKGARPVTKTATLELEWAAGPSPRLVIKRFICWEFLGIGGEAVPGAKGGR